MSILPRRPQGLSRKDVLDWFLSHAAETPEGCLVVPGAPHDRRGYIRVMITEGRGSRAAPAGRRVRLHRVALELKLGRRLRSDHTENALHQCGNSGCINVEHIYLGTQRENAADAMRHKVMVNHSGERHGCARYTDNEVREMRAYYRLGGCHRELAAWYGGSEDSVRHLVQGRGYPSVSW